MMPVYLVGLAGPAGAGKSTVAQALCGLQRSMHLPEFKRLRFAGPLKDMLLALGLTREQVDGADKETPCRLLGGRTPRWAMQTLGTEWGRACIDPDLWVRATMLQAERELIAGYGVVIDDVRFDNEAAAIAKLGIVVQLSRHGTQASAEHASEAGVYGELIDYVIPNNQRPSDAAHDIAWLIHNRTP